ncbi:MAG: BMFP domain-containing protein YqiC [Francisellaceae bacterium]|jgi:BMFP domain-containing protein YqiC
MFDPKIFDEMTKKFNDALPPALKNAQSELEKNFKSTLTSTFHKMDLVTREEFDIQLKVLERTREKVENLQKQLDELVKPKSPPEKAVPKKS